MLHVTIGDVLAEKLRAAGLPGHRLPWRDILYDGSVPETASHQDLAAIRAAHLAGQGFGREAAIRDDFLARDNRLAMALHAGEELILWFEPDLTDQLALLQVLDRLADFPGVPARLADPPGEPAALLKAAVPVAQETLARARAAFAALRAPDPRPLAALAGAAIPGLPHLPAAIRRHLEEFPWVTDGLTRTQRAVLTVLANGPQTPPTLFAAVAALEEAPFLGDWSLYRLLADLIEADPPRLIVLNGVSDGPRPFPVPPRGCDPAAFARLRLSLPLNGTGATTPPAVPPRLWRGGVRTGPNNDWRYDPATGLLAKMA